MYTSRRVRNGLLKDAGMREFLRFALTGRSSAVHGTTEAIARRIRQEGLIPRKSRGIVDVFKELGGGDPTGGKNLAFITRSIPEARTYAGQQGMIESLGTPTTYLQNLQSKITGIKNVPSAVNLIKSEGPRIYNALKTTMRARKHGVVDIRYPWWKVKTQVNPEMAIIQKKFRPYFGDNPYITKALATLLYGRTSGIPGQFERVGRKRVAISPEYIKGGKGYKFTSIPELKSHFTAVAREPANAAFEALRNLTGWQHIAR